MVWTRTAAELYCAFFFPHDTIMQSFVVVQLDKIYLYTLIGESVVN